MYTIAGKPVDELVREYGTPLYVYDENAMRQRLGDYRELFQDDEMETEVVYASKAFSCLAMVRLAAEYGFGLDVVSGGELYTAEKAGFDMSRVYFHGNNKTLAELQQAVKARVGTIIVDNVMEAEALVALMQDADYRVKTLLRINPGIEAHTHHYIVTAHVDSKFGIAMTDEAEVVQTIRLLQACPNIEFAGLDAHIGSQIFDRNAFAELVRKLFAFAVRLQQEYGIRVHTLDLGGGFAARYTEKDAPIPLPEVCRCILDTCREENRQAGGLIRKVIIEPGRSIVAEAGYMLYTVGFMKTTPNRHYIFVDGGMSDNIRPALYQAEYDALIAGREEDTPAMTYTVAGKCCESGDVLIDAIKLPKTEPGDILVMKTTGAYGYAMASRYNKLPVPGVVFVRDGQAREVIARETYEDLISHEK